VIKTDNNGIEEWNQVFGDGNCHETGYCIKQTSDGGYIISGTKFIVNHDNALFIKTDINGNEEWNMTIITDQSDIIYSICETDYNSYVSTGYTYTYGAGNMDIWLLNIGNINNQPPNKPTISGPSSGKVNEEYNYSFVSTDVDGDEISYYIEWGEGTNSGWTRTLPSGEPLNASHIWEQRDSYTIKAKAKDENGAESEWATLEVSMPKRKVSLVDTTPPSVSITKPEKALYINDEEIMPFFVPLIFGHIQIWPYANDNESGLNRLELYINDELIETFTSVPRSWTWDEKVFGKQTIKLIAYDNAGNDNIAMITVWKFF
jgi:hypothetical protein